MAFGTGHAKRLRDGIGQTDQGRGVAEPDAGLYVRWGDAARGASGDVARQALGSAVLLGGVHTARRVAMIRRLQRMILAFGQLLVARMRKPSAALIRKNV